MIYEYVLDSDSDVSYKLVKYYCEDISGSINGSEIVITSCDIDIQAEIIENNPDLLLISIVDRYEEVCDNRMYKYFYL